MLPAPGLLWAAAAAAERLPCMGEPPLHRVVLTGEGIFSSWLNTLADLRDMDMADCTQT